MATTTGINSNTAANAASAASATAGKTAMSSADFMKVMLTQLEHQDPLNPTDSNQLLTQMAQISQLQSNQDMQSNIESLTLQQSIGAAGNLIGKDVNGLTETGDAVTGSVTSVRVSNKTVYLELDNGKALPMKNVMAITDTSALAKAADTDTPASAAQNNAANQILQYLASLAGNPTPATAA
jgi:flagellar basal-body rod modification protein FlgD